MDGERLWVGAGHETACAMRCTAVRSVVAVEQRVGGAMMPAVGVEPPSLKGPKGSSDAAPRESWSAHVRGGGCLATGVRYVGVILTLRAVGAPAGGGREAAPQSDRGEGEEIQARPLRDHLLVQRHRHAVEGVVQGAPHNPSAPVPGATYPRDPNPSWCTPQVSGRDPCMIMYLDHGAKPGDSTNCQRYRAHPFRCDGLNPIPRVTHLASQPRPQPLGGGREERGGGEFPSTKGKNTKRHSSWEGRGGDWCMENCIDRSARQVPRVSIISAGGAEGRRSELVWAAVPGQGRRCLPS